MFKFWLARRDENFFKVNSGTKKHRGVKKSPFWFVPVMYITCGPWAANLVGALYQGVLASIVATNSDVRAE